jgi:hypothetical protein
MRALSAMVLREQVGCDLTRAGGFEEGSPTLRNRRLCESATDWKATRMV